jgi:hypothetical protein
MFKWIRRLFVAEGENRNTEAYQLWKQLQQREKELLVEAKEKDAQLRNEALELKEKELYLKKLKLKIKEAELKEELGEFQYDDDDRIFADRDEEREEDEPVDDVIKTILGGVLSNVSTVSRGNTGSKRADSSDRGGSNRDTKDTAAELQEELTDEQRRRTGI